MFQLVQLFQNQCKPRAIEFTQDCQSEALFIKSKSRGLFSVKQRPHKQVPWSLEFTAMFPTSKRNRWNAVTIQVETDNDGNLIWYKNYYNQKKEPNKSTTDLLDSYKKPEEAGDLPSLQGDSSIVRTEAHGRSLSARSGFFAGKGTTNSRADQANSEKNSENLQGEGAVMFSYVVDEDGKQLSERAFRAKQDGKFPKSEFVSKYGVAKKDFDVLLHFGFIRRNEWHHTAKTFEKRDFFEWGDLDDNYHDEGIEYGYTPVKDGVYGDEESGETYSNYRMGVPGDGTYGAMYAANKKEVGKIVDEYVARRNEIAGGVGLLSNEEEKEFGERLSAILDSSNIDTDEISDELRKINDEFNKQLDDFTVENANNFVFYLGMPSEKLIEGGVVNKPLKYYGNKLRKKIEEHGFNQMELKDLPIAIANPIAVFNNYGNDDNRSILTELKMRDGNVLVAVNVGKGSDIDFNIIRSTFGKDRDKIENWLKRGYATFVDKKKILNYQRLSAPIAVTTDNPESFSDRKGTTNSRADQTNSEKNSENLQGGEDVAFSIRTEPAPKKTGIGYKVFFRGKDGKLYPPMVANPNGADTPVGVWLNADEGKRVEDSKTGRPQVKQGGKGTQGGSGKLAYRPGWHLGKIPYALQFNRMDENGEKTLFPKDFVWAEVEYAMDNNYQEEAMQEGVNANGKFQHSLAGLKRVPTDGYYEYRTNPNPETDPWIITGAMKVNKILTKEEVDDLVRKAGREPQRVEGDEDVRFAIGRQRAIVSDKILSMFKDAINGNLTGKSIKSNEGKKVLENLSGLKFKDNVDFRLNPSDLIHIFNNHFGDNEKDKGKNIPLSEYDIKRIVDVLCFPNDIVFGVDNNGRNVFYFFLEDTNGTYNLMEIYSDKRGNLTAKTYYKTKKGVSRRVMDIKSLLSTSKTYSDTTFSGAKIPQIFDITLNFDENFMENSQGGEDVRFSISAEQDREYMAAVESGDMEKAAFKAKFPWVSAPVPLTLGL